MNVSSSYHQNYSILCVLQRIYQVIEIAKISIIIENKKPIIQANVDHEYLVEKCGNVCKYLSCFI